jgi:hypothetical protein
LKQLKHVLKPPALAPRRQTFPAFRGVNTLSEHRKAIRTSWEWLENTFLVSAALEQ